MELAEAAVHASHEVTVILHILAEGEQETGATVAVDDFPSLGRDKDGVKAVRLLAVELDTTVMDAVRGKGKQVADVDAKEAERENKTVNVAHLPVLHGHVSQRPQYIGREVTLCRLNTLYTELAERVERSFFFVDGIVEHGSDISQMNVASIHRGRLRSQMQEERAQPVGGYISKGQMFGTVVIFGNALPSRFVYFTRALVFNPRDEGQENRAERHGFWFLGRGGGEHEVAQLLSRAVGTERERHEHGLHEAVIIAETVEKIIVYKITVGTYTHTRAHGIPLVGHYRLGEGNVGSATTVVNGNAQGAGAVMLGRACVEVYLEGSHIFNVRLFCG